MASTLSALDRASIWHPFTQMQTAAKAIPITRAQGLYLYSEDNQYMDGISSWWVNLHGHAHPHIVKKIQTQVEILEHVIFAGFTHAPAVELALRLLKLLPSMSKVFYSDNGSTAVEVALKIALQYWYNKKIPRTKIICFNKSYHGDTFGAMSAAGRNAFNKPFWSYLFEVESIDPPFIGKEQDSLSQLNAALKQGEVACFIFEPLILGAGGMHIYSSDGLIALMQSCKQRGVLTIADEVMTGFGRTGTLFACPSPPDLICLSKGLTGGFLPLGATICTEEIFNAFLGTDQHQAFLHGHSYTANPLACASALGSLDLLLEPHCAIQLNTIAHSHQAFCKHWQGHPKLKRCEYLGTILVLEYHEAPPVYDFFLNKGILLRPLGNVLYVMPPYCIQKSELQFIYDQIILTLQGNHA